MAVAALNVAQEMGIAVPDELSIVAGDDSQLCVLVRPALTALAWDIQGYGRDTARVLLDMIEWSGGPVAPGGYGPAGGAGEYGGCDDGRPAEGPFLTWPSSADQGGRRGTVGEQGTARALQPTGRLRDGAVGSRRPQRPANLSGHFGCSAPYIRSFFTVPSRPRHPRSLRLSLQDSIV